jgi:hypothetical protein
LVERFFNKIKHCRRVAATTSSPRTTLPSFNSRRSGYGCVLMSPRPNLLERQSPALPRKLSRFCRLVAADPAMRRVNLPFAVTLPLILSENAATAAECPPPRAPRSSA